MSFNPASAVQVAADNVAALRQCDVYRALESNYQHLTAMGRYITDNRPDLADEVAECIADIKADQHQAASQAAIRSGNGPSCIFDV
jgi:hypothetical protein